MGQHSPKLGQHSPKIGRRPSACHVRKFRWHPPLSFPPPTPTGVAGVRSSTIKTVNGRSFKYVHPASQFHSFPPLFPWSWSLGDTPCQQGPSQAMVSTLWSQVYKDKKCELTFQVQDTYRSYPTRCILLGTRLNSNCFSLHTDLFEHPVQAPLAAPGPAECNLVGSSIMSIRLSEVGTNPVWVSLWSGSLIIQVLLPSTQYHTPCNTQAAGRRHLNPNHLGEEEDGICTSGWERTRKQQSWEDLPKHKANHDTILIPCCILWLPWFGLLVESQGYSSVSPAVADLRLASHFFQVRSGAMIHSLGLQLR